MPAVVRKGDWGLGHSGYPPTRVMDGSVDVLIMGVAVARAGDALAAHRKHKHPLHARIIANGVPSVLVNGRPIAVSGGAVSCGGALLANGHVEAG